MEIVLDDNFKLTSDAYQIVLNRKYTNTWQAWSYHITLQSAIENYLKLSLRLSDAKSILELLEFQKTLLQNLKECLKPLKLEIKELLLK